MKRKQYIFFWMIITIFLIFSGMTAVAGSDNPYEEALDKAVNYYVYNQANLTHWQEIVGLAEAGEHVWEDPWQLPEWDIDDLDENSGVLDYIALIFSLDGAGEDPADMAGRNLMEELADLQGENGSFGGQTMLTYWAMIALDQTAGNYDEGAAVSHLLSQQHDNGGFSWINKTTAPDTDSTGTALLALANHQETAGVRDAIENAIDYLRDVQKENGGFGTDATALEENCESTAYVIMGLLACEEDIVAEDWQKNDSTMTDALLRFQLSNGSFCHIANTSSNSLATRQALMALARIVESGIGDSGGSGEPGGDDPSGEKTVRVRVEGHTNSLADERVTVRGTALDALKEAVGEDQVVAPGGWITQIKEESGRSDIGEGINTNWMYYVIRDGGIEPGTFDLGAGSYNVEDGDEIIFYLGASDASTWEAKTYLPQVSVSPGSITAGETITIAVSAKKYVWLTGLSDLTAEEIAAIGDYTVQVGENTYTSSHGQVVISNITAGIMDLIVSNTCDQDYPEVVTYKKSIVVGAAEEKEVRVRVEGHTNSLADERVTVRGTALDALKEAVGEDQVVAPGGWITQIKEESGRSDIGEGINTNWMYYVIRDGGIEPGAFDLGAGSYNVEDGDEIIFYLGASDASTWEAKTYLPQVSVSPGSITAGETITIAVSAKKYVWPAGLSDLTAEETAAIGNYTVMIGEKTYASADGQVSIPNVTKGTMHFTVTNGNDQGYPDVVTYKGSFSVGGGGSPGGGSNSDEITVKVAVVGKGGKKDILFLSGSVVLSKDDEYGWTALGALDATGLDWESSKNNEDFVMEIEGQRNQGQNGWMYKVNGDAPESSARVTKVSKRDEVIWWYSDDPESEGPTWSELVDEGSVGGVSDAVGGEVTKSTVTRYKDDLAGLTENKLLNSDKKMTEKAAAALKEELAKNTVSLSLDAGKSEYFLSDQEVSLLIPEQGLSQTTKITVQEVGSSNQPKQFAVQLGSSVYEFGPGGTKFNQPVTIAIKVPLTEDIDVNQLSPAWYNEETKMWVTIPAVIDLETGLVVFQIDHFTKFAVIRLPERKNFSDVGESLAWAKDAVEILAGKGFINGTGTGFEPKRSISRAEFVKIMVIALGLEPKTYEENLFEDVKTGDWFAGYVQTAYENRIITGGQGENFRPRDSITRNEVAAIFCRLQETDPAGSQSTVLTFKDAAQIPAWAVQGIRYVHQQGLMTGYGDGTFQGSNSLTRAEAAVTVYRFLGFREK